MGIYSPTAFENPKEEYNSPWGTEAEAPLKAGKGELQETSDRFALERARLSHGLFRGVVLPRTLRSVLLFFFGVVYGIIIVHLHENNWIVPVKLGFIDHSSWQYLGAWGVGGVTLGNILPWLDILWASAVAKDVQPAKKSGGNRANEDQTLSWDLAVRSVGAFVGIAFALVGVLFPFYASSRPVLRRLTSVLSFSAAAAPVAIHCSSIGDSRAGESRNLVPHRPHKDRILFINHRWIGWHVCHPGAGAGSCGRSPR